MDILPGTIVPDWNSINIHQKTRVATNTGNPPSARIALATPTNHCHSIAQISEVDMSIFNPIFIRNAELETIPRPPRLLCRLHFPGVTVTPPGVLKGPEVVGVKGCTIPAGGVGAFVEVTGIEVSRGEISHAGEGTFDFVCDVVFWGVSVWFAGWGCGDRAGESADDSKD
ncbi:hypothetical protein TWF694_009308 [Orbilia ellipsospora]|uniref:Uncharacterized protein n=1 Tax=Orbilia ellipsospora TaxID=2528407 RepID=A0AAV9XHX1_9PEZI